MKHVSLLGVLAIAASASAQTTLAPGDLALVGYNASNPDQIAVLTTRGLESGTSFYFADYGWNTTTNTFRFGGEGYVKVTLNRAFTPGEVMFFDSASTFTFPNTADFSYVRENNGIEYDGTDTTTQAAYLPSGSGDQVFLFQASSIIDNASPAVTDLNLLYGLNADGTSANSQGWQANATNSNTSGLPGALVPGTTAIGMVQSGSSIPGATTEFDNYQYTGIRTGTPAELLSAIGDRANWEGRDSTIYTFNTTKFNVTPVPEPASMAVLGLGIAALKRRRRK